MIGTLCFAARSSCHLCGEPLNRGTVVNEVARHGEPQTSVACATCGLVQATPLPTETELEAYYAGPYRALFRPLPHGPHEPGTPEYEHALCVTAAHYAADIVRRFGLGPSHRVLEVGCGPGYLSQALARHGVSVAAMDTDPGMVAAASARGVDVARSTLAHAAADHPFGYFDVIVCSHVLEHFVDPLAALAQMRSLLVPGGRVWIEVPDVERPYGDLGYFFQRPHLWNFSARTLALLLERAGFDAAETSRGEGSFVLGWGVNGTASPKTFAEALAASPGITCSTGTEVAAHLRAYQAARDSNPGLMLERWLDGDDAAGVGEGVLRSEVTRLAEALMVATNGLARLAQDLDAQTSVDVEREWSADPWQQGYRAGLASMGQRVTGVAAALANSIVARSAGQ